MKLFPIFALALLPCLLPPAARGNEPPADVGQPAEPKEQPVDPTVPDAVLQKFLINGKGARDAANAVPPIALRGKVIKSNGAAFVLVEVDDHILVLKKGVAVSLSGSASRLSIQLTEISRDSTVLEVLPLKQTIRLQ